MMCHNGSCGCNRCNSHERCERINVGGCGCGNNFRRNGCMNTCPRPCPHPCRPKPCPPRPCCERGCEERAREIYQNGVERAREEFRCCMRNCHRRPCGCGNNQEWDNERGFEEAVEEGCGCHRFEETEE